MNRREIRSIGLACVALAEQSFNFKGMLPVFGVGPNPDWPIIADQVRVLRRHLEFIESSLGELKPVLAEDLQWRLCKHDLPDDHITVLVSIVGDDDAHEAYRDLSGETACWRYSNDLEIREEVYAWTDMPPALLVRQDARLLLPAPEERRAS